VLRARVLGALEVELDGKVIASPASQRPWSLFAYLALADGPVPRSELINRFWPEVLDQSARASLRSALWTLRRRLGDAIGVAGDRVWLRDEDGLWIDAREFERLLADAPSDALELCRGDLLEEIDEDWASSARERHRERVIALLEELAAAAEREGRSDDALELTRRQVDRDRFGEAAHRRLIVRLEAAGDRAAAIRVYKGLSARLRSELGVAPSAQTRELADRLRDSAAASTGPRAGTPPAPETQASTPPAPGSPPDAPARLPPGSPLDAPARLPPGSPPDAPARLPPGLLPLTGRDRELAELEQTWRAVVVGRGAAALIRGEPGIGKTRLAAALTELAAGEGAIAAVCAALDLGGAAPLSLWAELLRELLHNLPERPPADAAWPDDLAVLVPGVLAGRDARRSEVAPDLARTRLFEAVVALIDWSSRTHPLLLVFEDLHDADEPSLELAGYVARRLSGSPVMMLLTRRELPHRTGVDRLEHALRSRGILGQELALTPLADAPVAALAGQAAAISASDIELVVSRADGNALLAVETARALARGDTDVAPGLRGLVRATLAPLEPVCRELAELIAVAGRRLELSEIARLGLEQPDRSAAALLATGLFVQAEGGVAFGHALLRDAAYEEIPMPRRPDLHRCLADALLTGGPGSVVRPAEVARHLRLAGADADAVPELVRAGVQSRELGLLEPAVAYLEEALAIAPGRSDLLLELGEIEAWRGRRVQAETAFEEAMTALEHGGPVSRARALLRRARVYHGPICVPSLVLESARAAIALLAAGGEVPDTDAERSEALAAWAWAEAVAGSVDRAEDLLARLAADGAPRSDLRVYDVGHARAFSLMRRGRFVESYGPSIAAGEAVARAGRPDLAYGCWANAAGAATAAGEGERALEFLDRGLQAIGGHGLQGLEIHLLAGRSFVLRSLGRLAEAGRAADQEQRLAERLGQPELLAMAAHDRGLVALAEDDHDRAVELLAAALAPGAPISRPQARLARAEALARAGDVEAAEDEVREMVLEPVRPSDFPAALVPRLARVQGLIALARHDPGSATRRLEEAISGWRRLLERSVRADSMTTVLADLGRPVVGMIEPERELAQAESELAEIRSHSEGGRDALVP
jgi:DNA-binding SARP family transcriptional activator/tetratricopeptide (TPR) repeat protein